MSGAEQERVCGHLTWAVCAMHTMMPEKRLRTVNSLTAQVENLPKNVSQTPMKVTGTSKWLLPGIRAIASEKNVTEKDASMHTSDMEMMGIIQPCSPRAHINEPTKMRQNYKNYLQPPRAEPANLRNATLRTWLCTDRFLCAVTWTMVIRTKETMWVGRAGGSGAVTSHSTLLARQGPARCG